MKKEFPVGNWFPAEAQAGVRKKSDWINNDNSNGSLSESYGFKVVNGGEGEVRVLSGAVNTQVVPESIQSGKPDKLWLKVTFDENGDVNGASVEDSSGTSDETTDYKLIAHINWVGESNNTPIIVQGIKGSIGISSCGATHLWSSLYS